MSVFARSKLVYVISVGGFVLLAIVAGVVGIRRHQWFAVEHSSGAMPHEVYVWQRHWGKPVAEAIKQAALQTSGFSVLAAEVNWKSGRPNVVRVDIDYAILKSADRPVSLCLRIGPYSGGFGSRDEAAAFLCDIAACVIADAREAGLEPAELQIDYDCAESRLDEYRKLVGLLRDRVRPVSLTITALPCWLKRRVFARLARASDGYVLQVHSLERPVGPQAPISLCDAAATRRWVEQAGRIGVRFRVALPTYGYVVAFDGKGRLVGLSAEGPTQVWNEDMTVRVVMAEPVSMAGLVQSWQDSRPANMQGIIWYRLPVETDSLNWKWVTLSAVMAGRMPRQSLCVRVDYPEPALAEISLVNDGEVDMPAPAVIELGCEQGKLIASDGLRGFALAQPKVSKTCLVYSDTMSGVTIGAGERWKVGWLRFTEEMEVNANVRTMGH